MRFVTAPFVCALLVWPVGAFAQSTVPVEQILQFVRSSIQLKQPDKQVAAQLHGMHLSEKLADTKIEALQGEGAGPKTVAALRDLSAASQALAPPAPPAPPPVRKSIPEPSYEDQQHVINQMREYALGYSSSLPDFICKQVTRRYYDPLGKESWRTGDTIVSKLSYSEQKEKYDVVMANGSPVLNRTIESFGGTTSSGEFGSLLKYIFEPKSDAEFHWEKWGRVRNHICYVFTFAVDQPHSQWGILDGETKREVVPAYSGEIFVDRETSQVLRIFMQSVDIPSDFPIQLAQTTLDYDYSSISGHQFLLPLKAEIRLNRGRFMSRNDVEFRSYQKFSADAVITFDTPDPVSDPK
ncbi:MAG: hypothetical protein M3Z09_14240 [Acidobacteriota bacterium]|nr:hypothetical protein [Acidobacteriota bacterium]